MQLGENRFEKKEKKTQKKHKEDDKYYIYRDKGPLKGYVQFLLGNIILVNDELGQFVYITLLLFISIRFMSIECELILYQQKSNF